MDSSAPDSTSPGKSRSTHSASASLPNTGPTSRATATCAPSTGQRRMLWATPTSAIAQGTNASGSHGRRDLRRDVRLAAMDSSAEDASQLSMFSAADFPASPTRWLADVPDPTTSAISGLNSLDSFASLNPDGSWRKTSQGYSQVRLDGSLEPFSETWPRAGMTRSGTAYLRPPLAPLTDVTECGSWPTQRNYSFDQSHAPGLTTLDIRVRGLDRDDPKHQRYWPTARASDAIRGAYLDHEKRTKRGRDLADQARTRSSPMSTDLVSLQQQSDTGASGSLNPAFVEWLMGYPIGWTVCAASATRSSRRSRNGSPNGSSKQKG